MNEEISSEEFAPWLAVIITVIGGCLRVLLLESKGMWLDETFSVWLAGQPVPELLGWIVRIDQHPPLYYLLLHYWMLFSGDTPYYARLLSVLFGTATIPLIYLTGKRMSSTAVGLAAAAFLAFSPFHIYFAQEARMYTLLTFNAAAAVYALVRLLTDPRSSQPIGGQFREYLRAWRNPGQGKPETEQGFSYKVRTQHQTGWRAWLLRHRLPPIQSVETDLAWVAFIVFSAATMLSHNTAVLFSLATNVFVIGLIIYQGRQKEGAQPAFQAPAFGNWLKAQIAILLIWAAWIPSFIRQVRAVDQRFWIPKPTWDAVLEMFKSFLNASLSQPAVSWALYALVLCLGLMHYRKKIPQFLFLLALFAIPLAAELLVSLRRPIFLDRTLLWTTIPLFLLLAGGIAQMRFRFLMIGAVCILGTFNLFSTGDYLRFFRKEDWNAAARCVAASPEKGDLVLFNSNFTEIPFNYYFEPYEDYYLIQVEKQGVPRDLEEGVLEPEMKESDIPALIALLRGHKRVWLVYSHNWYTDPDGLIPKTLAAQMTLIRECDFYGGRVFLYEAP